VAPARRIIDNESLVGAMPVEVRDSSEGLGVTVCAAATPNSLGMPKRVVELSTELS
jgi:hypothetical protein